VTNKSPFRILVLGHTQQSRLEQSYVRAFQSLGHSVSTFPIQAASDKYIKFGRLGATFHRFVPIEAWGRKGNRDFILEALSLKPDLICLFIPENLRAGPLAQLLCSLKTKVAMIWPDPLLNFDAYLKDLLPLVDVLGTYSSATIDVLHKLGGRNVQWLPLAADPGLHSAPSFSDEELAPYRADVSFVGEWRPERDRVIARILSDAPEFKVRIWGPSWERSQNHLVRKVREGRRAVGMEFAKVAAASHTNINVIDPMNHTAANMRFFELSCCGGLQLSTYCGEMSEEFRDRQEVVYVHRDEDWAPTIREMLKSPTTRSSISQKAKALVLEKHTYRQRAEALLSMLGM
jgi:spore maturation protein CgeB